MAEKHSSTQRHSGQSRKEAERSLLQMETHSRESELGLARD